MSKPNKYVGLSINDNYVEFLEQTLKDIANPLSKLERLATENGDILSPYALQVANDVETLKLWANEAIRG